VSDYAALLAELAVPRLTGTTSAERVRAVLKRELAARGFVPMEHRFTARSLLYRLGRATLPGVNLIAVRPHARVATWLVAHYDAKGQRLSMAGRLAAAGLAAAGLAALLGTAFRAVMGEPRGGVVGLPLGAVAAIGALGAGGLALCAATRVTDRSPGAVDNASGVLTVLATVDALPREAGLGVGIIFTDAEEYGLLGARALARERAHLLADTVVINFDGIDDRGPTLALLHRAGPLARHVAKVLGARRPPWLPVVVDGLALAPAARESLTIMRGGWDTARVVHTPRDAPGRLTLEGVRTVGRGVAAALRAGRPAPPPDRAA
jgi:Peptidase family M28